MFRLTPNDCELIQELVDDRLEYFAEVGFEYHIDDDLNRWVRHMESAPGILAVAATFDPRRCHLTPDNSYWQYLTDRHGDIVACAAHKVVETDDFLQEVLNFRLYFNRGPVLHHYRTDICVDPMTPTISGRVGYGGGLWIHPSLRGGRIASSMARLDRALSLRHFRIDWNANLLADDRRTIVMGRRGYRIAHDTPLTKGVFPLYSTKDAKRHRDMRLFYMSAAEIIAQLERDFRRVQHHARPYMHMPPEPPRLVHSRAEA